MEKKRIRFGLREKVLLTVIGVSMLITAVMSFIFYRYLVGSIQENYKENIKISLQVCADTFDDIMKEAYFTCTYATASEELKQLMHGDETYDALIALLQQYRGSNSDIQSVYCYIKEAGQLVKVSADGAQVVDSSAEVLDWMNSATLRETGNRFSPMYNIDTSSMIQRQFFTYGKRIYDGDGQEIGRLFVNVDERNIYFKCLKSEETQNNTCYMIKDQLVVSATDTSALESRLEERENTMLVSVCTAMTDYSLVSISDLSAITADLRSTKNWILLVALLLNILLCMPVFFIVRGMMRPMGELEKKMERVKEGDLSVRAEIYHRDEIGSLSENFNDMIQQIELLIDELVTERMLKKEAEIEALQYQITPHFMYNTLSSIRYAAALEHSDRIAALLQAFIELLRLSASDRGAFITVQQEMQMVENYVMMQKFRYADSFEVEMDVAPDTKRFYVPRLLVQPLVENAILHGLNHREKENRITIRVMQDNQQLAIKVEDNGAGMTKEEIYRLMHGERRSKFSGIGISNIQERLRLYYGEQGSLRYDSEQGKGTSAVIVLPVSDDPDAYTI
ncbi:histidine kinase [Butyricicoccus sp.]|uniref:sensor histidine kinase n=1 Tax=Butyricicoccus sp. TaxID=2049021 RepID=UPI003F16EF3E